MLKVTTGYPEDNNAKQNTETECTGMLKRQNEYKEEGEDHVVESMGSRRRQNNVTQCTSSWYMQWFLLSWAAAQRGEETGRAPRREVVEATGEEGSWKGHVHAEGTQRS